MQVVANDDDVGALEDPRRPLFVFGPYAVRGVVDLLLAVVTAVPLAAAALVVYGPSTSTGSVTFSSLTPNVVRGWHATLLREGSPTPARQSYALLRSIMNTAVADELLVRNPCLVRGAGVRAQR